MSVGNFVSKKLNVLVYSDNGTTIGSVRHCLYTLRRLLAPTYAVIPVTADMLINEPWAPSCALLVIPGGADRGYCASLNGAGNRRIEQFVRRGGAYLGFCAGGYYGSGRCEFAVGDPDLEVVGDRELKFFPAVCRGPAFKGFVYNSEAGARAAKVQVARDVLDGAGEGGHAVPESFRVYYNGGGVFVDALRYADQGIQVLASYDREDKELDVDAGEGAAAVIYCKIGEGAAVLTGPHPEFAAINLNKSANGPEYAEIVDQLAADDGARTAFLKACLKKLGLQVSQGTETVPSLSCLHLSSVEPDYTRSLTSSLNELITRENSGESYLKDDNDTFLVRRVGTGALQMQDLEEALPKESTTQEQAEMSIDYNAIIKRLLIHEADIPPSKITPSWNHHAFYSHLKHYQSLSKEAVVDFGRYLLYGEVVTSTNTLLEKNTKLLRHLPTGFTAVATVQIAGRGRGSNVWVSPAGALMFSTVIRHPIEKMQTAPVVFIQYLAAMAVVRGIKSYDRGYEDVPVKMKWPNDVYAMDPAQAEKKQYTKICGILVNSHFSSDEYVSVVGIGLNATNASPTTSLNAVLERFAPAAAKAQPLSMEKLLARILTVFEELYLRFLRTGFDSHFEDMYYADWLHMDQIVTLEQEGGVRARIKGITRDYGLLLAEELGLDGRRTGKVWQLQSDSNSFDFFKGLVRRKV